MPHRCCDVSRKHGSWSHPHQRMLAGLATTDPRTTRHFLECTAKPRSVAVDPQHQSLLDALPASRCCCTGSSLFHRHIWSEGKKKPQEKKNRVPATHLFFIMRGMRKKSSTHIYLDRFPLQSVQLCLHLVIILNEAELGTHHIRSFV